MEGKVVRRFNVASCFPRSGPGSGSTNARTVSLGEAARIFQMDNLTDVAHEATQRVNDIEQRLRDYSAAKTAKG